MRFQSADVDRLIVEDSRKYRAVTYLPHGQRFEGWLPAGAYRIEPEREWIAAPRPQSGEILAQVLVACGAGHSGKWYVGAEVALT